MRQLAKVKNISLERAGDGIYVDLSNLHILKKIKCDANVTIRVDSDPTIRNVAKDISVHRTLKSTIPLTIFCACPWCKRSHDRGIKRLANTEVRGLRQSETDRALN